MSCVIVSAKKLIGRIEPPPYKSEVIRLLILAGLCGIRPAEFVHLPNNCGEDIKNAVIAVNDAFFNTDAESNVRIHIEGLAYSGLVGYQKTSYTVKK